MPFIRIYVDNTISKENKKEISNAIHNSLIESFNIPIKDKFQVFIEVDKEYLIFPDEYLGNSYSNILFINITCKEGRTKEQKRKLYELCAKIISEKTKIKKDNIFITIIENHQDNWSFGNGIAQLME